MEYKQLKPYPFRFPFYVFLPTVWTEGNELYIKTSFFQYIISLFSHCRIVHVSKEKRIVEIKIKKWWKWESPIRIAFSKIDYINLTYPKTPLSGNEIYDLFLITKDPFSRVNLFRFGSTISDSPIHQEMAKNCAGLIVKRTNTRFGPKTKDMPSSDFNDKYICTACGHQLHPDSEFVLCPYCGGKEIRIVYFKESIDGLAGWKSYPNSDVEIERRHRPPPVSYFKQGIYVLIGIVGLIIIIYSVSQPTVSKRESNLASQPTNQFVPEPQAHEAIIEGYNFYKKGDFNNAIAEYTKAVDIDPNNNEAYYYRGRAYVKTGEDEKALSDFIQSIELDPHHFESYRNLDWVLAKQSKWDTIINYWNEFIQLESDHAQAYLERGGAYYHQGNWVAALKDAKQSCSLGNSEGCMRHKQLKQKIGN